MPAGFREAMQTRMNGRKMNIVKRVLQKGKREYKKATRLQQMRHMGIIHFPPNYLFNNNLSNNGVVVDVGCSHEAEFSLYMIEHYSQKAFAVDPTKKHREALTILEEQYSGRFVHLPLAVSAVDGYLTFHESKTNESGSILNSHVNVQNDETTEYEVESVSLRSLRKKTGVDKVEILKLDLEGAEYELLDSVEEDDLRSFNQIFVEFHHHAIDRYNEDDTRRLVEKLVGYGFKSFTVDDLNYLFYDKA